VAQSGEGVGIGIGMVGCYASGDDLHPCSPERNTTMANTINTNNTSVEELLKDEIMGWPVIRQLITTDQMPGSRVAEIYAEHPAFAVWMQDQHRNR
jgi:hypothetical protein